MIFVDLLFSGQVSYLYSYKTVLQKKKIIYVFPFWNYSKLINLMLKKTNIRSKMICYLGFWDV